jgi:hypothetical protein
LPTCLKTVCAYDQDRITAFVRTVTLVYPSMLEEVDVVGKAMPSLE